MIAVVLAGGRSSRMGGGDKGFLSVDGRPILARVLAALAPQCGTVVLNANGDAERFTLFGRPVVADGVSGQCGPLAGVLAGMDYAASRHPDTTAILSVPADVPFLPSDLAAQLERRRVADGAAIVQARSGGRTHGVVALWSMAVRDDLRRALVDENVRRVSAFAVRHATATVVWPAEPLDPFLNVNTPDDLARARAMLDRAAVT